jgi:uncharacterized protein (DUF1501 family)
MDAVYGADPKTAREVDSGIDVPYASSAIITTKGAPLGPTFKALGPWTDRFAVVHGVRQNSANHQSGLVHTTCCRSNAVSGTPTLLDVLGARRSHAEALGAVSIGTAFAAAFSPKYIGQPTPEQFGNRPGLLDHLDPLPPHELEQAARAMRREAKTIAGTASEDQTTAENLNESAALLEGWARAPRFQPEEWPITGESDHGGGKDLQRALWLFENGLARCATVALTGQNFDTHVLNTKLQPSLCEYLAELLAKLFGELDRRVVDGRSLASQTIVMVGSEIGRFPRLNAAHGKDHFPQVSMLVYGADLATGRVYGGTDRSMVARAVALDSGAPETGGHLLTVDDIGTTMLALDGANPEVYGYTGARLRFLMGG